MSLFKSLQRNGGVITLFHNPQNALSNKLFHELETHVVAKGSNAYRYTLDVEKSYPTSEQFQFIKSTIPSHPSCKAAFVEAFKPLLTLNGISSPLIKDINQLDASNLNESKEGFEAPLVVDWDHKLIARDLKDLSKILEQYDKKEE